MERLILKAKLPAPSAAVNNTQVRAKEKAEETAMKVFLYKTHFTLSSPDSRPIPYQGPLSAFISSLNSLLISHNVMSTLPAKFFENGRFKVEVVDHRYGGNNTVSARINLNPSPEAIWEDLQSFGMDHFGNEWDSVLALDLEQKVLPILFPSLDLDVDVDIPGNDIVPSLSSHAKNTIKHYNSAKYTYPVKRTLDTSIKDDRDDIDRQQQTKRMVLAEDEKQSTEFYPRFSQLEFVEEWRKKKKQADEEALIGLGDKTRIKITAIGIAAPKRMLVYNQNRRIVKTLRFESVVNNYRIYSIFNAYDIGDGQYEGVLRYGTQEGTSIGGLTLRYPIGNKHAVDYYTAHFRGFYGILHKVVAENG